MNEKEIIRINGIREDLYQAMQIGSITLPPQFSADLYNFMNYQDKEIERLNNIINELEEYHIKSMKNLENTEDFKYVGTNHIKILHEEHKRTLDKLKELKESGNNEG